ncbi:MAG: phospholipase D-like domain-containing protein [Candidatus Thermoplasmatota archaeon]
MKKLLVYSLVLLILITPLTGSSFEGVQAEGPSLDQEDIGLRITKVYYNTGPGSEFLTIENRAEDPFYGGISLSDGNGSLSLEEVRLDIEERLVLARDHGYEEVWDKSPDLIWSNESAVEMEGDFDLDDSSGKVILSTNDDPIDSFYYGDGEDGELWKGEWVERHWKGEYAKRRELDKEESQNDKEEWSWERRWMVGHSDFEPEEITYEGYAEAYVSPDSSLNSLLNFINETESSLHIAIYQLDSLKIAEKIADVSQRGVDVKVLAEGSPVGAISDSMHYTLSLIKESGAEVRTIGKEGYSPYDFLHCKYVIRDNDSVLVSSENFGDSGYSPEPSWGNRGWGVILEEEHVAEYFLNVYESDLDFSEEYVVNGEKERPDDSKAEDTFYSPEFDENGFHGEFKVKPLLSPDTSMCQDTLLGMIESAEDSIYVQQAYINHWSDEENPYVTALKDAALRDVQVKVLIDSTWYQMEEHGGENDVIARELNTFAEKKDVPLEARLLSSYKELLKIHNKGMVVDGSKVMISSINWNPNSVLQNREVGVILENEKLGEYYSEVFMADWTDNIEPIADPGPERTVEVGSEIVLSGENSWDDHNIVEYRWDLDGDGTYDESGQEISVIFEETGTHEVELYVEDVAGNSDTSVAEIEVENEKEPRNWRSIVNWLVLLIPLIGVTSFLAKKTLLDSNRF